jgi:hypothetical protein
VYLYIANKFKKKGTDDYKRTWKEIIQAQPEQLAKHLY